MDMRILNSLFYSLSLPRQGHFHAVGWKRSTVIYAKLVFLFSFASLFNFAHGGWDPCLVTCSSGTFSGVPSKSRSLVTPNFPFCSFLGIRYAVPPTGDLRFARPRPAPPITGGVYNATTDGNVCPQKISSSDGILMGSEDCLFLNVYTPQIDTGPTASGPQRLLPVMSYIFGTGYVAGSSKSNFYGPDYLVPQDVVLVTFNYRLNSFGFLYLEDEECSGNQGLADMILALQWVQKNIRSFGGDPKNVTLFGESSGGQSAYLLTLSPSAQGSVTHGFAPLGMHSIIQFIRFSSVCLEGLFHKVIIQSSLMTKDTILARNSSIALQQSIMFARFVGYLGLDSDHKAILRYLRTIPVEVLSEAYFSFFTLAIETDFSGFYHTFGAPLHPCVDSSAVKDPIIPTNDFGALGASVPAYPIMMGHLDADGSRFFMKDPSAVCYVEKHLDAYLKMADPIFVKDLATQNKVVSEVKARYYTTDNQVDETVKLLTVLTYYNFYKQISQLRAAYANGLVHVYLFRFAEDPYDTVVKQFVVPEYASQIKGAVHGEEVIYLFYVSLLGDVSPTDNELSMIKEMSTLWTNFAKTGNPNKGSVAIPVVWEPTTPTQDRYLEINNQTRMVNTKIFQDDYDFFVKLEHFARNYKAGPNDFMPNLDRSRA